MTVGPERRYRTGGGLTLPLARHSREVGVTGITLSAGLSAREESACVHWATTAAVGERWTSSAVYTYGEAAGLPVLVVERIA